MSLCSDRIEETAIKASVWVLFARFQVLIPHIINGSIIVAFIGAYITRCSLWVAMPQHGLYLHQVGAIVIGVTGAGASKIMGDSSHTWAQARLESHTLKQCAQ